MTARSGDHRPPLLSLKDVSFHYNPETPIFSEVSFDLDPGTFCLVHGPSGAGKSTLLRLINRMEEPASGEISFQGQPLSSYFPPLLRRKILFIQQTPTVIDGTVKDNLLLPFGFKHNRALARPDDNYLKTLLNEFRLDRIRLEDHAQTLSVGQLQRVCFIRGLLLSPEIMLLDEPTSALDRKSAEIVEAEAENRCKKGLTVMMISHSSFTPRSIEPINLRIEEGRVQKNGGTPSHDAGYEEPPTGRN